MLASLSLDSPGTIEQVRRRFLDIQPRIESQARFAFRHIRCAFRKADCIAETVALCWRWFLRLIERGKDATRFASVLASLAARAVRCGRRLCGQLSARDAMSELAQGRHRFEVRAISEGYTLSSSVQDALYENTQADVPEQVAFRVDFPAWCNTLTERDRRLIEELMLGERTSIVARRFGLTPGRISQRRREFHADWQRFTGDAPKPCLRAASVA